jgi:hypothetical protein
VTGGTLARYRTKADENEDWEEDDNGDPLPHNGTKLGGTPYWTSDIGAFDTPSCPVCNKTTHFLGQIMNDTGMKFRRGDGFNIWLYTCQEEHSLEMIAHVE